MKLTVHGTDGPLVVKLAGMAGGIRLYDEEIAAAVAAGFRVAALDVSGDRLDDPPNRQLDWGLYADEVQEAIDRALREFVARRRAQELAGLEGKDLVAMSIDELLQWRSESRASKS